MLLGCVAASAYFVHYTINGTHGLVARSRLSDRSIVLKREIASLEAVRRRLRHDVDLIGADPPHPDLVEELARQMLGFARPGDMSLLEPTGRPVARALASVDAAAH
ncbi:MAG TPA: septum formation initiator family protein [Hyphomicrobiaceae bacterium]|nr:septum formation initiator family protein [Hyphomicrobiaceae bacterium]